MEANRAEVAECPDRPKSHLMGGCVSENGDGHGPCRYCGRDLSEAYPPFEGTDVMDGDEDQP